MLQPSDFFKNYPKADIPQLVRNSNDKFWIIPVDEYSKVVKNSVDKLPVSSAVKMYLIGLVKYMEGEIQANQLKNFYLNAKQEVNLKVVSAEFGEVLGPFFAMKYLKNRQINHITFPVRTNYEVFDFFMHNAHYYGFSSKALAGGSNTFAPRLIQERLDKMKTSLQFRDKQKELTVIKNLTDHGMFEGVVVAFGDLINGSVNQAKGFEISQSDLKAMFAGVDFKSDGKKIEANKDKPLGNISLSNTKAYVEFLNKFIIESTRVPEQEKRKLKEGNAHYTTTNLVYGFIKFISSSNFDFDEIMSQCFQDLNIVKMGISNDGVPTFKMQATVEAADTVRNDAYTFRSKAAFDRVRDKLGIQL
jgi:hypothetical protein